MNPKSHSENLALIRVIVAQVPCATCRRRFSARDVQILDRRDKLAAMAVKCRWCGTEAILFALVNAQTALPIRTDLTPGEWARFQRAAAINENDVIQLHRTIQAYDGDFSELMDEPLPDE